MSVCVFFGSSKILENEQRYLDTIAISNFVSSLGYDVASGGYSGVMEASLRGAVKNGVRRIGITCDLFEDRVPNEFLSDEIRSKDYFERLEILIDLGDFYIAMCGESGTLLEVSAVASLLERKLIEDRHLILVGSEWHNLGGFLQIDNKRIFIAEDINQACDIIRNLYGK
ncbi:MAG: LOG family protein [Candidatus Kapabacteria bacterium]|nr:LOG family protein [Ignavibacteriota bacterium]MCW5885150.1 LOG family protein [Candidatus Kapabacteria bacterium]